MTTCTQIAEYQDNILDESEDEILERVIRDRTKKKNQQPCDACYNTLYGQMGSAFAPISLVEIVHSFTLSGKQNDSKLESSTMSILSTIPVVSSTNSDLVIDISPDVETKKSTKTEWKLGDCVKRIDSPDSNPVWGYVSDTHTGKWVSVLLHPSLEKVDLFDYYLTEPSKWMYFDPPKSKCMIHKLTTLDEHKKYSPYETYHQKIFSRRNELRVVGWWEGRVVYENINANFWTSLLPKQLYHMETTIETNLIFGWNYRY